MTTSKSLPDRPSLESIRKQAKRLAHQVSAGDSTALSRVHLQLPKAELPLSQRDAQLVIAREYGLAGWIDLKAEVLKRMGTGPEWAAVQAKHAIHNNDMARLHQLITEYPVLLTWHDPESGDVILKKKGKLTAEILKRLSDESVRYIILSDPDEQKELEDVERRAKEQVEILQTLYDEKVGRLKRGDELPPGVIKLVKVYISMKRKIQVGDKMAGRHGNKGVVSRLLPEEDMPRNSFMH